MDGEHADKVRNVLGILQDEHGLVGRELPGALLLLPVDVTIEQGHLLYRPAQFFADTSVWGDESKKPKTRAEVTGALDEFVELAFPDRSDKKSSADIRGFAKKWGGLWLCDHGLPHNHPPRGNPFIDPTGQLTRCLPSMSGDRFVEPVKVWRGLARRAFVALRVAAALRRLPDVGCVPDNRRTLIQIANKWLANGDVSIYLVDPTPEQRWPAGVQFRLHPSVGLYGVLAAQLALAVTLSRQLYVCAECGKFFTPQGGHEPRTGKRAFCDECKGGSRVGVKHAMRDLRARQRSLKPEELQKVKTAGVKRATKST